MSPLIQAAGDGVSLLVHVQPNAKRTSLAGRHGDALKVRLAAPPVDGKANAELCRFLAELCDVPKRYVTLEAGATARRKRVHIRGATEAQVLRTIGGEEAYR